MNQNYLYEPSLFSYDKSMLQHLSVAHFHTSYEIYFSISGECRFMVQDVTYDLTPGDMILLPDMVPHQVMHLSDASPNHWHERYLLAPTKEEIPPQLLSCFDTTYYHPTPEVHEAILSLFRKLENAPVLEKPYQKLYTLSMMSAILCLLTTLPSSHNVSALSAKNTIMQNAATYIKEHCTENLSLVQVAQKYSYTPEYFSTLFKNATGFKYSEYVKQSKIAIAMQLLTTTELTITEIAIRCGFNNANYFSEVFQEIAKTTPKQFRIQYTS